MGILNKIAKGLFWCFHDIDEDNWEYKLVAFIGLVLRVGLLPLLIPEPFQLAANLLVTKLHLPQWAFEILIRLILAVIEGTFLGRLFYKISFTTVGNLYDSGSEPVWGSICYSIYYFVYNVIAWALLVNFAWWVIGVILTAYVLLNGLLYFISFKIDVLPDNFFLRLILHILIFLVFATIIICLKHFIF